MLSARETFPGWVCDLSLTREGLMSFYTRRRPRQQRSLPQRFRLLLSSFFQQSGLPFADVLDADHIQQAFEDEQACFGEEDDAVFTPAITLWARASAHR